MSDTLAAPVRFELEVRKSRFLAQAASIDAPAAALAYLDASADRDATHNCWAYRIGQQYRFSDDGEPGGTAGKPILAAIDGQGFDRVVVVVTRWFGGIKLGAGGLVRAYGGSAAECLRRGLRQPMIETVEVELHCDFSYAGAAHALIATHAASKLDESYESDGIRLQLRLPASALPNFERALRDATRGQATIRALPLPA
jgi:uncharacterized YigZ family protein